MSGGRVSLDELQKNYKGETREAFEDMSLHMFMRRLRLCTPPVRRVNQEGIESDPVKVEKDLDDDCKAGTYAFQAKWYDPQTKLSSRKNSFLDSIAVAKKRGVTDLFFFVNKHLTEKANSESNEVPDANLPEFDKAIRDAAKEADIKIHWYSRDVIETDLEKPDYGYIRRMFLVNKDEFDSAGYYHYIVGKVTGIEHDDPKDIDDEQGYEDDDPEETYDDQEYEDDDPEETCDDQEYEDDDSEEKDDNQEHGVDNLTGEVDSAGVYGDISLAWGYIEPVIRDRNGEGQLLRRSRQPRDHGGRKIGHKQSVRKYLEAWVQGVDYITIICGEPGHGKTSLSRKAVYDFYKEGWLANRVENVFCFSLNPVGFYKEKPVIERKIFEGRDIGFLLSYADDNYEREEPTHTAKKTDCGNALIFLDGFDELYESIPGHSMEEFLETVWTYLCKYENRKPHIVITTRKMAIPPERVSYTSPEGRNRETPIKELQPISEKRQYEWIRRYGEYLQNKKGSLSNPYASYIDKYQKMYEGLNEDDELREILGIPIIFRMIVAAEFIPASGDHPAVLYDKLFDKTLERHHVGIVSRDQDKIKRGLSFHALRVYADNGDSSEIHGDFDRGMSPWIYSFYTRYKKIEGGTGSGENILRVGFLHKTFFEYFLAHEILSWLENCKEDGSVYADREKTVSLADLFAILGHERLSEEVLSSIRTLYEYKQKGERKVGEAAFESAYRILKKTDGILTLPKYGTVENENELQKEIRELFNDLGNMAKKEDVAPFKQAENVFWNVLSICSMCGHPVRMDFSEKNGTQAGVNERALRSYNLEGVHLEGAVLTYVHLEGRNLSGANLSGADLTGANLAGANLMNADLKGACLDGANLKDSVLSGADFSDSHLRGAVLIGAYLSGDGILIKGAVFRNAHMEGAYLDSVYYDQKEEVCRGTSPQSAAMDGADFAGAHLNGAFLSEEQANIVRAAGALGLSDELPDVRWNRKRGLPWQEPKNEVFVTRNGNTQRIDLAHFGHYKQGPDGEDMPLSWRLLRLERDKALIVTEKLIECRVYHSAFEDITWKESDLREWMNGEFLQTAFPDEQRAMIAEVCNQNPDNRLYGTKGGNSTWDRVFALSIEEAETYFRTEEERKAGVTPYAESQGSIASSDYHLPGGEPTGWWWLRSPGYFSNYASYVLAAGSVDRDGDFVGRRNCSVRPALWLNL